MPYNARNNNLVYTVLILLEIPFSLPPFIFVFIATSWCRGPKVRASLMGRRISRRRAGSFA
ncbi:hypothetical protein BJX64DRAFT_260101 [Aspergillus heterothallicus]